MCKTFCRWLAGILFVFQWKGCSIGKNTDERAFVENHLACRCVKGEAIDSKAWQLMRTQQSKTNRKFLLSTSASPVYTWLVPLREPECFSYMVRDLRKPVLEQTTQAPKLGLQTLCLLVQLKPGCSSICRNLSLFTNKKFCFLNSNSSTKICSLIAVISTTVKRKRM